METSVAQPGIPSSHPGFTTFEPSILYFGTPVVLITTMNEDGTPNLAPMSSCWTLGWTALLGLGRSSKTFENLVRARECVLNVPSPDLWPKVERLASVTGKTPVPAEKTRQFTYEPDKFGRAGLTPLDSATVVAPRVSECPIQMEATVADVRELVGHRPGALAGIAAIEVVVQRVHVRSDLVLDGRYVDATAWSPLIYNFRHYFGLGPELGKTFRAER